MSIQYVIFDLDGTIIDSLTVWHDIDVAFFKNHGMVLPEDYQTRVASMPFEKAAIYTKETYHFDESVEEIVSTWMTMAQELYAHKISFLDNGVKAYLDLLYHQHITMILATSCDPTLFEPCLKRLGIDHYFKSIYCVKHLPYGKTDQRFFKYIVEDIQCLPGEILFYDDLLAVVKTAKESGLEAVQVTSDYQFKLS